MPWTFRLLSTQLEGGRETLRAIFSPCFSFTLPAPVSSVFWICFFLSPLNVGSALSTYALTFSLYSIYLCILLGDLIQSSTFKYYTSIHDFKIYIIIQCWFYLEFQIDISNCLLSISSWVSYRISPQQTIITCPTSTHGSWAELSLFAVILTSLTKADRGYDNSEQAREPHAGRSSSEWNALCSLSNLGRDAWPVPARAHARCLSCEMLLHQNRKCNWLISVCLCHAMACGCGWWL